MLLARLAKESGLPDGSLNIVYGDKEEDFDPVLCVVRVETV